MLSASVHERLNVRSRLKSGKREQSIQRICQISHLAISPSFRSLPILQAGCRSRSRVFQQKARFFEKFLTTPLESLESVDSKRLGVTRRSLANSPALSSCRGAPGCQSANQPSKAAASVVIGGPRSTSSNAQLVRSSISLSKPCECVIAIHGSFARGDGLCDGCRDRQSVSTGCKWQQHSCHLGRVSSKVKQAAASVLWGGLLSMVVGCSQLTYSGTQVTLPDDEDATRSESVESRQNDLEFDAGLIIAGEPATVRFPLPTDFVSEPSDVISIDSSCHCAVASVFEYSDRHGNVHCGLQVDFKPDTSSKSAANLLIIFTLKLLDAEAQAIHVSVSEVLKDS